jgi:hypothetical protein
LLPPPIFFFSFFPFPPRFFLKVHWRISGTYTIFNLLVNVYLSIRIQTDGEDAKLKDEENHHKCGLTCQVQPAWRRWDQVDQCTVADSE